MLHPRFLTCCETPPSTHEEREAWKWAKEEQEAFEVLKCLIMSTPILVQPDQNAQFRLETDASGYVVLFMMACGTQ